MPDDLSLQIPLIREALESLGIPVLSHPRYEADDVLATLAVAADRRGIDTFICTSDKDCRQLITDRVRLFNLRKREEFGRAELLADWGITPEQVVDLQTLVGDSVDNVPGVAGIGVQDGGQAAPGLRHPRQHPGQHRQDPRRQEAGEPARLRRHREAEPVARQARRRRARRVDWDDWKRPARGRRAPLRAVPGVGLQQPRRPGPRRRRGPGRASPAASAPSAAARRARRAMFAGPRRSCSPSGPTMMRRRRRAADSAPRRERPGRRPVDGATYRLIDTPEAFAPVLAALRAQPRFAFDLETTSLDAARRRDRRHRPVAGSPARRTTSPCAGRPARPLLDPTETLEQLRPLLEDPARGEGQPEHQVRPPGPAGARRRACAASPATA